MKLTFFSFSHSLSFFCLTKIHYGKKFFFDSFVYQCVYDIKRQHFYSFTIICHWILYCFVFEHEIRIKMKKKINWIVTPFSIIIISSNIFWTRVRVSLCVCVYDSVFFSTEFCCIFLWYFRFNLGFLVLVLAVVVVAFFMMAPKCDYYLKYFFHSFIFIKSKMYYRYDDDERHKKNENDNQQR